MGQARTGHALHEKGFLKQLDILDLVNIQKRGDPPVPLVNCLFWVSIG